MAIVNIAISFIAVQDVTKLHAIKIVEQDVNMSENLHCTTLVSALFKQL